MIGVVTSFSLPPYNFFFLNFFTFPILYFVFISINKEKKKFLFIYGWMFGFGYFLSNLYWIANSLTFDEIFKPFIPITIFIIPLFLGIFYGLVTFISSFFKLKKDFSSIFVFVFVFAIIEFVRGQILGGFPWNLIAFSITKYLYSIQILSLIGTYSYNLFVLTIFILPVSLLYKKSFKIKLSVVFLLCSLILSNYLFGLINVKNYNKINLEKIDYEIKIINPKISIERYFATEDSEPLINEIIKLSDPKVNKKTVYIFPEGVFSHIYFNDLKYYREIFKKNFNDKDIIIMGVNTHKHEEGKNIIFNSLVVVDNNLNILSQYNKIKLVPFGEFLPFENILSKLGLKKITQGYQSFSSSKLKRKNIKLDNLMNFLPLICYEIIYSGELNNTNEKYNFIINISEDGWFGNSIGLEQHFSHSIFRSIEEGKSLIRSSNNGISAYINPVGQVINKIESTKKGVIVIKDKYKAKNTFFSNFGNKIFFYFLIFYIILIFFIKIIEKRNKNEKGLFIYK